MAKKGSIQIHDVKRRVRKDGVRVTETGYIVKSVGRNGEILQCSEVINEAKSVKTHLAAMNKLWNTGEMQVIAADYTAEQKFTTWGVALPAK